MDIYVHSPNTSSWQSAYLSNGCDFMAWYFVKHRDNFTFTLNLKSHICDIVQIGHLHVPLVLNTNANIMTVGTGTPATADMGLNADNKG
jgi:predicted phosphodiesterase